MGQRMVQGQLSVLNNNVFFFLLVYVNRSPQIWSATNYKSRHIPYAYGRVQRDLHLLINTPIEYNIK